MTIFTESEIESIVDKSVNFIRRKRRVRQIKAEKQLECIKVLNIKKAKSQARNWSKWRKRKRA